MKGPELVEGLDPKPLNVRVTDPKRVEVYRAKRHQTLAPPFSEFVLAFKTKFDCIVMAQIHSLTLVATSVSEWTSSV